MFSRNLPTNSSVAWIRVNKLQDYILLPPASEVYEGNVFTGVYLSTGGGSVSRGALGPGRSLPRGRGVSFKGVGLCLSTEGGGFSVQGEGGSLPGRPPRTLMCGRYVSYWNVFLYSFIQGCRQLCTARQKNVLKSVERGGWEWVNWAGELRGTAPDFW